MVSTNSHNWVDQLQQVTESYNHTFHRSIQKTPAQVTKEDSNRLWKLQYEKISQPKSIPKHTPKSKIPFKLKIGDYIRLSDIKHAFDKEYDETWSREHFIISDRFISEDIAVYRLKDILGEQVKGTFQEAEMQKVYINSDEIYRFDKILKSKGKGKNKMHLVSWLGWPRKFSTWVRDSEIINFRNT